jgi:hypothetical protein
MTAEVSRDSVGGSDAILSSFSNEVSSCFLVPNRAGLKTKGKENITRLQTVIQINGPMKKKPTNKKIMEDMPAPKTV